MQQIIKANYSGSLSQMSAYISISIQAIAVIIGGIVLWRVSISMQKKKEKQRTRNTYFDTPYSRSWKRKS